MKCSGLKDLPRLELHFRRHGHELGADTVDVYEQQFLAHIQKSDLQIFTFLKRADNTRMWYLIDEVSSSIAVYNETRKRLLVILSPIQCAGISGSYEELLGRSHFYTR